MDEKKHEDKQDNNQLNWSSGWFLVLRWAAAWQCGRGRSDAAVGTPIR
jgi:hypothetical protein